MSINRTLRRAALAVAALTTIGGPAATLAHADDGFGPASLTVTSTDDRAGAHPDVSTSFSFNTKNDPTLGEIPAAPFKTVRLSLPAGLVGDAAHTPQCPASVFGAGLMGGATCPDDAQVGVAVLDADLFGGLRQPMTFPVYNVAPASDEPAVFGFSVLFPQVKIAFGVRATDGGLDTLIQGVNQGARVFGQTLTLWGVPQDPSHDSLRGSCLDPFGGGSLCSAPPAAPRVPLLRNPTSCTPQITKLSVASWVRPATFVSREVTTPAATGCADVPFAPTVTVTPETTSADAPTGLDVEVKVPQPRDPDGLASADVRTTVVTLPEGYAISPSAADGLQACDAARVGVGDDTAPRCPDASKVGSATIVSPILAAPLTGPIFLGPSDGAGHFKVYVSVAGSGVRLKLTGDIAADPVTGRLTTTFADTPQQPFESFTLHFDGGPRAVLASPAACGTADATAALTPWSGGAPATLSAPVALGGGACATGGFAPTATATAGVTDARAGADTGFTLQVAREDRTAALGAIASVTLPAGLTARVGSVPLCGAAAAAAGTCGAASRVGSVDVAAGPGSHPLRLRGTAYLTEGYKGAPFGLSLVVPAIAGPYDLGTVVVRSAVRVARTDARITVQTDPLPQVLGGIPLRLRSIGLTLDRAGFMVNPTSCADAAIGVTVAGAGGAESRTLSSRFGLSGCKALKFAPTIKATAKPSTKSAGAGLHVALRQTPGQANLKAVRFGLPLQMGIKVKALGTVCTADQLARDACPAASQVGGASAVSPILGSTALKGPVYLVQGTAALPSLVAVLRGGGLTIQLEGSTSQAKSGRLTTTFGSIPDVPISAFDLDLPYGKRSILETTKLPCSGASASVGFTGQNGATRSKTIPVTCAAKAKAKTVKQAKATKKAKATHKS